MVRAKRFSAGNRSFPGKTRRTMSNLLFYIILLFICLFFLFPIFWMVSGSIRTDAEITAFPPKLLAAPDFDGYSTTLMKTKFLRYAFNSFIIAAFSTLLGLAAGLPAAYVIARLRLTKFATLILTSKMTPTVCLMIPWFIMFRMAGLIDTYVGMIISHLIITVPMAAWLLIGFFEDIPPQYEEAAALDGCSRYGAFFRVVVPMAGPGIASAAILNFTFSWNNFLFALVFAGTKTMTVPVTVYSFITFMDMNLAPMFATATLMVLPALALVFFSQEQLLRGMIGGES
jgi:multiple sugar transport system permease protein